MNYKVILRVDGDGDGYVLDERDVSTDEELFACIGKFAVWYFLALDTVDYKDAYNLGFDKPDCLLAFTTNKETDKPNGPHRHGSPKGVLARGKCWYWDSLPAGSPCALLVREA